MIRFGRFSRSNVVSFQRTRFLRHFATKRHDDTLVQVLRQELKNIEAAGTYKRERIITSPQSAEIEVFDGKKSRKVLNFWYENIFFFFFGRNSTKMSLVQIII